VPLTAHAARTPLARRSHRRLCPHRGCCGPDRATLTRLPSFLFAQHDYYFDACADGMTVVSCQNSQAQGPVAIQTWGQPPPQPPQFPADSCAALGAFSTETCHATNSSLSCDFTNGDGGRSATFMYTCGPAFQQPTASQPDPQDSHYVITFSGPAACSGGGAGGGGGWGKTFLILFPLFTFLCAPAPPGS
jgi:hypothetical protein